MSAVPSSTGAVANGLTRPIADLVAALGEQRSKPGKPAKTLPPNIERRLFPDTQIIAYRLAA